METEEINVATSKQLVEELRGKLICGICHGQVGEDAVEMVCPGRCTYCFGCVVRFVEHLDSPNDAKCPICRTGRGSVTPSPFLRSLACIDQVSTEPSLIKEYMENIPVMKNSYPSLFCSNSNYLIFADQMKTFSQFKKNPASFEVMRYNAPPIPGRNTAPGNETYAAVNINFVDGVFSISMHNRAMGARRACTLAPEQFGACFVVAVQENVHDATVLFQSRPVQIFMHMGLEEYITGTFPRDSNVMRRVQTELNELLTQEDANAYNSIDELHENN